MDLSRRIRQAREAAGLSQQELARRVGVSRSAVCQWEAQGTAKRTRPDLENLQKLARETKQPVEWLMGTDELNEPPPPHYSARRINTLTENEKDELIEVWADMPPRVQRRILDLLHILRETMTR